MSTHVLVVETDAAYLERLAVLRPVTDDDRRDAMMWHIECSDPAACPGWVECDGDHAGFDPEDETSPGYDRWEDVMIHGELHDWRWGHGWTVAYSGCPVIGFAEFDPPDECYPLRPSRWPVDVDWDDTVCVVTVAASPDGS